MRADKKNLIHAVNESLKDLQSRIDKHCCLVAAALERREDKVDVHHPPLDLDFCSSRLREQEFKQIIQEAIRVLEQSRKSFKSKQLEVLRKKSTKTLIDMK